MTEPLDSVNRHIARVDKVLKREDLSDAAHAHYTDLHQTLMRVKALLLDQEATIADLENRLAPLSSRLGDLSDLPPELLEELSAPRGDDLEYQIVDVVQAYGGTADLDQILVGLFRKFEVVQKRRYLQNKIWRMSQKEMLWSIKGKKGVYTIREPDDEEKEEISQESSDDNDEFPI